MNFYTIPIFITSLIVLIFGVIVYFRNKIGLSNKIFALVCLTTTVWLFFSALAYNTYSQSQAELLLRICYIGIVFIPITLFHFVSEIINKRSIKVISGFYILGIVVSFLILFSNCIISGTYSYFWGYYPKGGEFHPFFLIVFVFIVILSITFLTLNFFNEKTSKVKKNQIKYLFLGIFIFNFSSLDFFGNYGISLYPTGYISATCFLAIICYSIIKHRLMDTSLVFTRTGIFIFVYSIVLGGPFALAYFYKERLVENFGQNWWLVPMISLTLLATAGPFIYLYIQKRAEDQLLKEQRRYQATLSQASSGMGRIKDLKRLLALIVYVITRAVRLEHSSVYIYDDIQRAYILGAFKRNTDKEPINKVVATSSLVSYLIKTRSPVVYEEIKQRVQDYNDSELSKIEGELREMDAALVIPSLIEDRLLAILILGKKKSGKLYGEDDLSVFSILANQAALSIENAQFYEDVKKTQEQLFQAEKMATIGTMADGLSHQINNRLHALGFIAGDALDTLKMKRNAVNPDELKEVMTDLEHSLTRIQENVVQGGEIVQGLLRYTRKGEEGFAPVEIDRVVTAALEMAQFKIKTHELKILREYDLQGPKIKGNFTQLQEVFFNMIDNAYDAMMQRKNEKKEPGYQPTLRILSEAYSDRIVIKFVDNGIGVRQEDFQKIFTPFFTTKLSSKKGTGLGLYVIKKIVDDNHKGKVTFTSKYMEGTTMKIDLPAVKG